MTDNQEFESKFWDSILSDMTAMIGIGTVSLIRTTAPACSAGQPTKWPSLRRKFSLLFQPSFIAHFG